ncbi:MAG: TonB-dependent receptor [Phenylobacterium sp.]|nr:TonB-dependent receptor [Phenylobacterium sp.]
MTFKRYLTSGSAVVMAAVLGTPVAAQEFDATVSEVIVTARKREERLQDVPTAGTALGAEQIRQLGGLSNTQELLANVPAVNFANTSSPATSEVSIRGSGTSRGTSAESAVGLYRDGVYIGGGRLGGRTFQKADLFDVGGIEALRGVQGALNGRNAVGGAINIVSARPAFRREGFAFVQAATNDRFEGQLVVNEPIGDKVAVRFGVNLMDQAEGFYYNPVLDRYHDEQETEVYRGQIRYEDGPLSVNLLVEHGLDLLPGLIYQVVAPANATYPFGNLQQKYELPWNTPSFAKQLVNYGELVVDLDVGFATITSTTALRSRRTTFSYDRDASSPEFQAQQRAAGLVRPGAALGDPNLAGLSLDYAQIFVQDVHIVGRKAGPWTWLAGAEFYDLNDSYQAILTSTPTPANRSGGVVGVERTDFTSLAAYGSVGYDVTENLNATVEARYTRDDKNLAADQFLYLSGVSAGPSFQIDDGKKSSNFSYTAMLGYKVQDWLLYGKVGSAYRAGGFNTALGDPRQPVPIPLTFENEVVTAFEAGIKGNITPRHYIAAAVFRSKVSDMLVQSDNGCFNGNPQCPVQATSFVFNSGDGVVWGAEIESNSRFDIAGGTAILTLGFARLGGEIQSGADKGRVVPQRPKWTANFALNYRRPIVDDFVGFFNINGNGRWGGVQEIAQTPPLFDYQIFNIRAGVAKDGWEAAVFSNNFANESYIVFQGPTPRRWNSPQTYGAELRYRW